MADRPTVRGEHREQRPTEAASARSGKQADLDHTSDSDEPTVAAAEAWAERESTRRQEWAKGPTEAEKRAWVARERMRRRTFTLGLLPEVDKEMLDLERRYRRDTLLALEGIGATMAALPFRFLATAVRSGQLWEDEYLGPLTRRRISLDDDF